MIADLAPSTTTPIMWDTPNRELSYAGRWLSPDPAGSGWNQYAYVTNPNGNVDPSGLCPQGVPSGGYANNCGPAWFGFGPNCPQPGPGGCNIVQLDGMDVPSGLAFGSSSSTLSGSMNFNLFSSLAKVVTTTATYTPQTLNSWQVTTTIFDSDGNQIGDPETLFGVSTTMGGWSLTTTTTDQMYSGGSYTGFTNAPTISAANNGTQQQQQNQQPSRLKDCAKAYYGFNTASGAAQDATRIALIPAAPIIPKAAVGLPQALGSGPLTNLLSYFSLGSGTAASGANIFRVAGRIGAPIAIASAVIDATAIGICASDYQGWLPHF
jgi:hypothetical protein